jgi:hypothetical protein
MDDLECSLDLCNILQCKKPKKQKHTNMVYIFGVNIGSENNVALMYGALSSNESLQFPQSTMLF